MSWAIPSSSNIRVDFDERCGRFKTGLAPASPHSTATAPAPASVS